MTITYPRDLPSFLASRIKFDISRNDLTARDGTGRRSGVSLGTPLWRAEYDFEALTDQQAIAISAWVNSLKGAAQTFIASDPRRWFPASVRLTGFPGGFTGTASSYSVDGTKTVLTLNGLPAGLVLAAGDLVGFLDSTFAKRHCVEVIEGGTASGGGVAVVTVNPAVWAAVSAWSGVAAHLNKPGFTARLVTSESPPVESSPEGRATRRISCIQTIPA